MSQFLILKKLLMILIQILNKIFIEIYITKNNIFILKINKNFL